MTGGYSAFTWTGSLQAGTDLTLGSVTSNDPIMNGRAGVITSFDGGSSSYHAIATVATGAMLSATWSDGTPLVAYRTNKTGRVVSLNFYPVSSDVRGDFWQSSTQGATIIANALYWARV